MNPEIIRKEIWFTAVRSRGPGGQNVNRTSSAAQLGWNFEFSNGLTGEEKMMIREKMAGFINRESQVYLRSDVSRDLEQNKSLCWEKLLRLIARAIHKDKPRKRTKVSRSVKRKRRESKVRRSETKKLRKKVF